MKVLLPHEQIQARVREMGQQIARDYAGREPHLVGVLKGACTFLTDLSRAIDLPITLDYIAVSSYGAATKSSGVSTSAEPAPPSVKAGRSTQGVPISSRAFSISSAPRT